MTLPMMSGEAARGRWRHREGGLRSGGAFVMYNAATFGK